MDECCWYREEAFYSAAHTFFSNAMVLAANRVQQATSPQGPFLSSLKIHIHVLYVHTDTRAFQDLHLVCFFHAILRECLVPIKYLLKSAEWSTAETVIGRATPQLHNDITCKIMITEYCNKYRIRVLNYIWYPFIFYIPPQRAFPFSPNHAWKRCSGIV